MRIAGSVTLALLTGACCCGPVGAVSRNGIPAGQEVAVTPLSGYEPDNADFHTRTRVVARNDSAWNSVAARLFREGAPRPAIDLSREIAVVAAMGSRSTGGFVIQVRRAVRTESELLVEVLETSPGLNCIVTEAITQPVHAVRIESAGLPVRFVEREMVYHCR